MASSRKRGQRRQVFLAETKLEQTRTSPIYRSRLARGLGLFLAWLLTSTGLSDLEGQTDREADQLLCDFVNDARELGYQFWLVKHAILAAQSRWRYLRFGIPVHGIVFRVGLKSELGGIGCQWARISCATFS